MAPYTSQRLELSLTLPSNSIFPVELSELLTRHALPHTLRVLEQQPKASVPEFSFVLPVFNEQENLPVLYERLVQTITTLGQATEMIFVDDGSTDQSWQILRTLNQRDKRVCAVRFARNFGHQTAISAGLDHARGEWVVVMDSDLQDPPEVIPLLFERAQEGYDVVYAVRRKRKESIFKRAAYSLFYRILAYLANISIPLDTGDFCLMHRRVATRIVQMPERNRFIRGIRSWVGYRQSAVEYERDARLGGDAKYNLQKLLKLALDGMVGFSHRPLRLATATGFIFSLFGFLWALRTVYMKMVYPNFIAGFTTMVLAILLLGGIQLITIGIIGEYIAHIFDEVKQRPLYIVDERLGEDIEQGLRHLESYVGES